MFSKTAVSWSCLTAMLSACFLVVGTDSLRAQSQQDEKTSPAARAETGTSGQTIREQVEFALSGYHYTPDREALDDIGPTDKVVAELKRLVRDADARTTHRTRAAHLLGQYDDIDGLGEYVRRQLKRLAARATKDSLTETERHAAELVCQNLMSSVAQLTQAETSVELLEPHLRIEDNLQRRLSALHAIGRHTGETGAKVLEQFRADTDLSGDEHRLIRSALSTYLDE